MLRRFTGLSEEITTGADAGIRYRTIDHLGSTCETTDATGAVRARWDRLPHGSPRLLAGAPVDPPAFAGLTFDEETGLYWARYRTYDPALGVWLSRDPLGEIVGVNLYAYCDGDPVNYVDPSGLTWQEDFGWLEPVADFAAGFGDSLSFGLTALLREELGWGDSVNRCSSAYRAGEIASLVFSLAFGAAHLGRNMLAQRSVVRGFWDPRKWNSVRRTYSKATGGLRPKGQNLHHTFTFQRHRWVPQGFRNAGFNYMPLTGTFHRWLHRSWGREWAFKAVVGDIYLHPTGELWDEDSSGCP